MKRSNCYKQQEIHSQDHFIGSLLMNIILNIMNVLSIDLVTQKGKQTIKVTPEDTCLVTDKLAFNN